MNLILIKRHTFTLRIPGWRLLVLLGCAVFIAGAGISDAQSLDPSTGKDLSMGASPAGAGASPAVRASDEPIKVTVTGAILSAFENNRLLKVRRLNPEITRMAEEVERAVFDPVLTGGVDFSVERVPANQRTAVSDSSVTGDEQNLSGKISQFFASGTRVNAGVSLNRTDAPPSVEQYESRAGLSVTQALLRGASREANLANLSQARLDTHMSQYELRGFSEALLAQVEGTYWDYALSRQQIETVEESLKLAEQQEKETREIISVGKLAETEIIASQAEIASRRQDLINARSTMAAIKLQLLRLINPSGPNLWQRDILLVDAPSAPAVNIEDPATHVQLALQMRPDWNQARMELQQEDLEIVKTKNGLLPKLDLFVTLGKTGYAESFGGSVSDVADDRFDLLAGISLELPLGNRSATALHRRSLLRREQAEKALENLSQLIELDVRTAIIEVNRARLQITATLETRKLQEEKLRVETEKFRVGKSTNLLVAQAQRDLLASQLSEDRVIVSYLKALIGLYRLEGSLLERRGISAPGRNPPEPVAKK
ncbi:MAG: TolC family protein [Desulfobacterales bacterium]|nr:TolC family protein [Desulfobacterales bacterium]